MWICFGSQLNNTTYVCDLLLFFYKKAKKFNLEKKVNKTITLASHRASDLVQLKIKGVV